MAPFSKLIAHPVLCEMISNCNKFRFPEFRGIFSTVQAPPPDDAEAANTTGTD